VPISLSFLGTPVTQARNTEPFTMEALMRLNSETLMAHAARVRERRPRPTAEKGDARRYPQHTLAPDPDQPELDLLPAGGDDGL
jgi:hypothetical protein